jgi:DNA-binding NtrC family response regulator
MRLIHLSMQKFLNSLLNNSLRNIKSVFALIFQNSEFSSQEKILYIDKTNMLIKPKLLIIDDETDILEILSSILVREGFEVDTATSGKEGLDKILNQQFDGVVTDLSMPGMDGLTMLKLLRSKNSYMPVIFLSGHSNSKSEHEIINYGAAELIVKPQIEKVPFALKKLLKTKEEIALLEKAGGESTEFLDILHSTDKKLT